MPAWRNGLRPSVSAKDLAASAPSTTVQGTRTVCSFAPGPFDVNDGDAAEGSPCDGLVDGRGPKRLEET
jgi:hypothetical protein